MVGQGTRYGRSGYHVWKVRVPGMVGQEIVYGRSGYHVR